jgi:hypothetical protein
VKPILTATMAALLASTTLAAAQSQPTNPPQQDYSQPRNDTQLQQEYRVPSSPVEDSRSGTTGQGRYRQGDENRNVDPSQQPRRPSR